MQSPFSGVSTATGLHSLAQAIEQDPPADTAATSAESYVQQLIIQQQNAMSSIRANAPPRSTSPLQPSRSHSRVGAAMPSSTAVDAVPSKHHNAMGDMQIELDTLRRTTATLQRHHANSLSENEKACRQQLEQCEATCAVRERAALQQLQDQVEQSVAQRRLDQERMKVHIQDLSLQWDRQRADLEKQLADELQAHQKLKIEHQTTLAQLQKVQQESAAMLKVYEGALESALRILAEEREAAAADNHQVREEMIARMAVLQTPNRSGA